MTLPSKPTNSRGVPLPSTIGKGKLHGSVSFPYLSIATGKHLNTHGHARFKTCSLPVNNLPSLCSMLWLISWQTDLYMIRPPPGSLHKAVDPGKIVFAGDSAGGGLCITTLTILRDLGLPMPAGAVLISPWVDLTHSFPSVMANTHTVLALLRLWLCMY